MQNRGGENAVGENAVSGTHLCSLMAEADVAAELAACHVTAYCDALAAVAMLCTMASLAMQGRGARHSRRVQIDQTRGKGPRANLGEHRGRHTAAGSRSGQVLYCFQAVHLQACADTLTLGVHVRHKIPHLHRQTGPIVTPPAGILHIDKVSVSARQGQTDRLCWERGEGESFQQLL